jgi:hypothetical protein
VDKGDRRGIAAAVARAIKERITKFDYQKSDTIFICRRYTVPTANAAAWRLIHGERCSVGYHPGFLSLASTGAAHRGVGRW